jgi:hypothetical protein
MATRSLGTLTLDLVARIGGFQQGMDRAARAAARAARRMEGDLAGAAGGSISAWQAFGGVLAGIGVGALVDQFIQLGDTYALLVARTSLVTNSQA